MYILEAKIRIRYVRKIQKWILIYKYYQYDMKQNFNYIYDKCENMINLQLNIERIMQKY